MQIMNTINQRSSEMSKSGKPAKNADIAKAVLRSQPPHAEDVPAMVEYYQKYGGGVNQIFVKDLCKFIEVMNISPSTRISGRHFQALANLNFGAEMPPHVVEVVLKRLAASEKVVDGVAQSTSVNDSTKFGTKYKQSFLEADKLTKKVLGAFERHRRSIASSYGRLVAYDVDRSHP